VPWDDRIGRRLKLKDLQMLMAVIEAGGIGKAAEQLNYSQPAVSKAIASLERTVGKRLFERGRKGIELTSYGNAMLKCGIAVFDDLRKGVADIDFLSDPTTGEIHVGCSETVAAGIVSAVINRVARKYPRIAFDVTLRNPTAIYRELELRNVDFAISQLIGHVEDEDHLQCEILHHEAIVVVAGSGHRFARKRHVELADLADDHWVLPEPGSFITSTVVEAFRSKDLEPIRARAFASSPYLRLILTAGGHFLTIVPASMLGSFKELPIKTLAVDLPGARRPVGIVTLKNRALSPVAQLFIEHARAVAKTMARS
jgi:DNA-binding transcriptional LysR family regulator